MKKLTILLIAVFLALCVGVGIAQMNKGDLINKQTETLDNSRKTVRDQDIMTPSPKAQQGRVLTDSDAATVEDEIMVIIMPGPGYSPDSVPEYRFGDGIKGRIPPSKMNKADLIEATSAKKPPKGYRYVLGFTPKEDGPFVVYSDDEGTVTAMLKKGDKKPKKYDHQGLAITDAGPQTTGDNGGTTCWRCYEINGELHCFEVDCPFDISSGEGEGEPSVSPEVLRTVIPKDPGSTLPPGSTIPQDPGRTTGTTTTGDPGRGSQDGSSSSSSETIIRRGGD